MVRNIKQTLPSAARRRPGRTGGQRGGSSSCECFHEVLYAGRVFRCSAELKDTKLRMGTSGSPAEGQSCSSLGVSQRESRGTTHAMLHNRNSNMLNSVCYVLCECVAGDLMDRIVQFRTHNKPPTRYSTSLCDAAEAELKGSEDLSVSSLPDDLSNGQP